MSKKSKHISLEYQSGNTIEILGYQNYAPYYGSRAVTDILREYPQQVTIAAAHALYMQGFIEGKRTERARRK